MRLFTGVCIILGLLAIHCAGALAAEQPAGRSPSKLVSPRVITPKEIQKGVTPAQPGPFQVTSVQFQVVTHNNEKRLIAAVAFNKNVDASTVQQNINIRLLRKNDNHIWIDASTQNNTVQVKPYFITWASGLPVENGYYVMHLRGTIKSQDGVFLDCDGDGTGEGGALPAYESQIYQVNIPSSGTQIIEEYDQMQNVIDSLNLGENDD